MDYRLPWHEGSYLAILSQIARVGNSADSGFLI
jgi:hypothetical protein